jgi:uncharacterized SAM-binding protein YcdF (DUF218 family)
MRSAAARPHHLLRFTLRLSFAGALVLVAVSVIRWQATLAWLGGYLVCTDPIQRADLILVMGGDFWGPRVVKAAELGAQGFAPLVLVSGPPYNGRPEGEFAVDFLVKQGYPRNLFAVFGHNQASTIGEVLALHKELARRSVKRVIFVTSAYHSRRCELLFRMLCPEIRFVSAPAPDSHYQAGVWWKDRSSQSLFFSEWSKILGSVLIAYPTYRVSQWNAFPSRATP